jgi:hypothetical protein
MPVVSSMLHLISKPELAVSRHGACFNAHTGDIEDAPALAALHSFKTELQGNKLKVTAELDKTSTKDWGRQPNLPPSYHMAANGVVIVGGGGGTMHAIESLREVRCEGYQGY